MTAETILLVDDHAIFREEAREMLETAGYDVIGEAANATDGIVQAQRLQPDLVLLDVQLPDRDGFSAALDIAAQSPPPRIVLISSREATDYGSLFDTTPAIGFIHKPDLTHATLDELVRRAG